MLLTKTSDTLMSEKTNDAQQTSHVLPQFEAVRTSPTEQIEKQQEQHPQFFSLDVQSLQPEKSLSQEQSLQQQHPSFPLQSSLSVQQSISHQQCLSQKPLIQQHSMPHQRFSPQHSLLQQQCSIQQLELSSPHNEQHHTHAQQHQQLKSQQQPTLQQQSQLSKQRQHTLKQEHELKGKPESQDLGKQFRDQQFQQIVQQKIQQQQMQQEQFNQQQRNEIHQPHNQQPPRLHQPMKQQIGPQKNFQANYQHDQQLIQRQHHHQLDHQPQPHQRKKHFDQKISQQQMVSHHDVQNLYEQTTQFPQHGEQSQVLQQRQYREQSSVDHLQRQLLQNRPYDSSCTQSQPTTSHQNPQTPLFTKPDSDKPLESHKSLSSAELGGVTRDQSQRSSVGKYCLILCLVFYACDLAQTICASILYHYMCKIFHVYLFHRDKFCCMSRDIYLLSRTRDVSKIISTY